MSVMAPHIRALRALEAAMNGRSRDLLEQSHGQYDKGDSATMQSLGAASMTTRAIALALGDAADALEAEEPKLREETPVNYNPKGKR